MLRGFENIENIVETNSARYLNEPGEYQLRVNSCRHHESTNPTKQGCAYFIAELTVEKSDNDNFRKGSKVSFTKELTRNRKAVEDVMKFMKAATNESDFSNIDEDFVMQVCGHEQLLTDATVNASVYYKVLNNGNNFAVVDFSPAS